MASIARQKGDPHSVADRSGCACTPYFLYPKRLTRSSTTDAFDVGFGGGTHGYRVALTGHAG